MFWLKIIGDYDVGHDEPTNKRQRLDFADALQSGQAFPHGVPVVIADEASVAALQAMDGSLADIQQHMAEGGHVTGHIAIPVAIAADAGIQVQGDLEHTVTLSQAQQLSSTLVDSSGHELDMSSVQVVSAPQTVVVTSLEAVTGSGQPAETVVVTSLDGVTTTRRTHEGFTIVTVPSQGGELGIVSDHGEQEKGQEEEDEDEGRNHGQEPNEGDSGTYTCRYILTVLLFLENRELERKLQAWSLCKSLNFRMNNPDVRLHEQIFLGP